MNLFIKIWSILSRNYKKKGIILFFLIILSAFLEVIGIGLIVPTTIFLLEDDFIGKFPMLDTLVTSFFSETSRNKFIQISLMILLTIYVFKNIYLILLSKYESKFSFGINAEIQRRLFHYYLDQDLSFHLQKNSAQLINNSTKETSVFYHVVMNTVILISEIIIFLSIALLLILYEPLAFITISLLSGIILLFYNLLTSNKLKTLGAQRQIEEGLLIQKIQQGLGGIREIKLYNRELGFFEFFKENNLNLFNLSWRSTLIQKIPRHLLETCTIISLITVILIFTYLNLKTSYIISVLALFGFAAIRILPSLSRIYNAFQQIQFGMPAVDLIFKELSKLKSLTETKHSKVKEIPFNNAIKLENLTFLYPETKSYILKNINLDLPKGKLIGIEGDSGSGKSTLVDLVLGLIEPTKGIISVDGKNISNHIKSWQKKTSYVPQNVFLIDDEIKRNIAFGIKEKDIDESKIESAIKDSELTKYVSKLPQGLQTKVGERGVRLSGGQAQRIGLARALYNDPELLVLDETTSSLDKETESKIMETIFKLRSNITVILISHDANLLSNCEVVFKINNNQVIKKK